MSTLSLAAVIHTQKVKPTDFMGLDSLQKMSKEWRDGAHIEGEIRWTPYFPLKWPLDKTHLGLVSYGFVEKVNLQVADGVRRSDPVVSASFTLPGVGEDYDVTLSALVKKVHDVKFHIQGVKPLDEREAKFMKAFVAEGWVDHSLNVWKTLKTKGGDLRKEDRDFFCLWSKGNGLTYKALLKKHPDFLHFLGCP